MNLFIYLELQKINFPFKRKIILILNRKLDQELKWYLEKI